MREFKFRIWDIRQNRYLVGDGRNCEIYPTRAECLEQEHGRGVGFISLASAMKQNDLLQVIVEQYTGFLDKEGVEVYEGDIIERGPYNHQFGKTAVVFKHGSFIESKYHYDLSFLAGTAFETDVLKDFRVIGNIHENGDLLK